MNIENIPVADITRHPNNPRREFDEDALEHLAASIEQHGVIQPITVRVLNLGIYQIISGERRWLASMRAGRETIPAIVREVDEATLAEMQMAENVARSRLSPIEEIEGCERLESLGRNVESIGRGIGRPVEWVQERLDLGKLPPVARDAMRDKVLSLGAARTLLLVPGDEREEAAQTLLDLGISATASVAREMIHSRYIEPRERMETWRRIGKKLADEYGAGVAVPLEDPDMAHEIVRPWGEVVPPWVMGNARIGPAAARGEDESVTWGDLARAHNIPLTIVPVGEISRENTVAVVNKKLVLQAEASCRDAGKECTLGVRSAAKPIQETILEEPEEEETEDDDDGEESDYVVTRNREHLGLMDAILEVYQPHVETDDALAFLLDSLPVAGPLGNFRDEIVKLYGIEEQNN